MIGKEALREREEVFYTEKRSDGIVNLQKYQSSKERILFVGKEPWDNQSRYTNQKDTLNYFCSNRNEINSQALIRANKLAYYILEPLDSNDPIVLDRVAWINVKKSPNTRQNSKSDSKELVYAFELNRDLLFRQIEDINPSVVIFGNTFNLGYNDVESHCFYDYWEKYRNRKLNIESFSSESLLAAYFDSSVNLTSSNTLGKNLKCYYENKKTDACLFFEICHFGVIRKWHYEVIPLAIKHWRERIN